ncbi:MAG: hypothetical protein KF901_11305 [Myxococcales bacterium]|nr:hypothetical protein [Myxococcales bacterium]
MAIAHGGCGHDRHANRRSLTTGDAETLGHRSFSRYTSDEVRSAVMITLRTQGYELVTESPVIRTAPKLIAVRESYAESMWYTPQSRESIAWDVHVNDDGRGRAVVRALLRGYVNGCQMDRIFYDFGSRTYGMFYTDLRRVLSEHYGPPERPRRREAKTSPHES